MIAFWKNHQVFSFFESDNIYQEIENGIIKVIEEAKVAPDKIYVSLFALKLLKSSS